MLYVNLYPNPLRPRLCKRDVESLLGIKYSRTHGRPTTIPAPIQPTTMGPRQLDTPQHPSTDLPSSAGFNPKVWNTPTGQKNAQQRTKDRDPTTSGNLNAYATMPTRRNSLTQDTRKPTVKGKWREGILPVRRGQPNVSQAGLSSYMIYVGISCHNPRRNARLYTHGVPFFRNRHVLPYSHNGPDHLHPPRRPKGPVKHTLLTQETLADSLSRRLHRYSLVPTVKKGRVSRRKPKTR